MGQTIHQESFPGMTSPVRALARRVHHILSSKGTEDNIISTYSARAALATVTPSDMIQSIRTAVKVLNLHKRGIDPDLVGVHSLRAGGAMALKLTNKSDTTIMKLGRWSGLTFLQYIHSQIAHLAKNISRDMNKDLPYLNIASIE